MVKYLAEKHDGIVCEENYHESLMGNLKEEEFPCLCYTQNMFDWAEFIRRTPEAAITNFRECLSRVNSISVFGIIFLVNKRLSRLHF